MEVDHGNARSVTIVVGDVLDCFTHSLVAFRITLVSEKSVDIAMLLRDVMSPLPMRADWGQDMAWPYPGIPKTVVAELAGGRRGRGTAVLPHRDRHHRPRIPLQEFPPHRSAASDRAQHRPG